MNIDSSNIPQELVEKLRQIKVISTDVDGVLTDGKIYLPAEGEETKVFSCKDGLRIEIAIRSGLVVVFFTGREGCAVRKRASELGAHLFFKKEVKDSGKSYLDLLSDYFGAKSGEVLHVGDDWGDLNIMTQVGVAVTPEDGRPENKAVSHFVTKTKAGDGVVSEIIEMVMRAQNTWDASVQKYISEFIY